MGYTLSRQGQADVQFEELNDLAAHLIRLGQNMSREVYSITESMDGIKVTGLTTGQVVVWNVEDDEEDEEPYYLEEGTSDTRAAPCEYCGIEYGHYMTLAHHYTLRDRLGLDRCPTEEEMEAPSEEKEEDLKRYREAFDKRQAEWAEEVPRLGRKEILGADQYTEEALLAAGWIPDEKTGYFIRPQGDE